MAIESITVQCYPSDSKINETVKRYEAFGWELAGNQRFQEFTGQSSDGDTITNHYSTYNKLTFSRVTGESWYNEVTSLETQHDALITEKEMCEGFRPDRPELTKNIWAIFSILFIASFVGGFILSGVLDSPIIVALFLPLSPILMIVTAIVRNAKYRKAYNSWFGSYYDRIQQLEKDAEQIRNQARGIVRNAK